MAEAHRAGELLRIFAFVELFLHGLAQLQFVDDAENVGGFGNFAELFEGLVERMLLGVGVETAKELRGGRFLEFDRGDEAQDVVPELDDVHLSLESVDKAYQDAVQSVGI